MAVAVPIDGGTVMPASVIVFEARGTRIDTRRLAFLAGRAQCLLVWGGIEIHGRQRFRCGGRTIGVLLGRSAARSDWASFAGSPCPPTCHIEHRYRGPQQMDCGGSPRALIEMLFHDGIDLLLPSTRSPITEPRSRSHRLKVLRQPPRASDGRIVTPSRGLSDPRARQPGAMDATGLVRRLCGPEGGRPSTWSASAANTVG